MKKHYRALSAVFPVILREEDGAIPLHRRYQTGYMDGKWDTAGSGHVDCGESAVQALIRECREELGIVVDPADVVFAHLCHYVDPTGEETYYNIYFFVRRFSGSPRIMEPEKCNGLGWFSPEALPEDMIPQRRRDVLDCLAHVPYGEATR